MKKLSIFIMLVAVIFVSCEKEQDMYKVLPIEKVTKPVLLAHDDIVITENNLDAMSTFKWQKADFGVPTGAEYALFFNASGSEPILITSAFGDSLNVKLEDLNKALNNAGIEPNTPTNIQFFVKVSLYEGYEISSEPISINVTTFEPLYPDIVYMIGQEFGSWDWNSDGVVEMTPINGHEGKFWAVRYFANPADGFKWNTVRSWGGDFFSLGTDVGFTTDNGNAFVSQAGFYIVIVDYTINTITIEPAKVYGMGDSFGGWNMGQYPFVANGAVMKLTTVNAGELRIYANSSASGIGGDWWRMEFVILNGKIAYRGNGGDQERVPVQAGKVVTLDFNNGIGTIE